MFNTLNITKIINSLNKGLTIASKIVPAYQKLKPILSNTNYLNNVLNLMNKKETKQEEIIKKVDNNLPTFFQ